MREYLKSTNIALDRSAPVIQRHLILTRPLLRTLRVIGNAAVTNSRDSAISIVGPYGTGKSTSVLCAMEYLCGTLPGSLTDQLESNRIPALTHRFRQDRVIPIVGEKKSLSRVIERSLQGIIRKNQKVIPGVEAFLNKDSENRFAIIIDELGKFLEYSLENSRDGDIYLLQQLAELANRSNGRFILVTIRHQALQAYIKRLQGQQLNEWKKIQGRFIEVVHMSSLEETLPILFEGISELDHARDSFGEELGRRLNNLLDLSDNLKDQMISSCFPLQPMTALILISAFKKIAQNERSLFSFLTTNERFGLHHFLSNSSGFSSYSLADFYDYLNQNLYHFIAESELANTWLKIGNALNHIRSLEVEDTELIDMESAIKTVGILECFGDSVSLGPTNEAIVASFYIIPSSSTPLIDISILAELEKLSVFTFRRITATYHLWRGSDINIENLVQSEIDQIKAGFDYTRFFKDKYEGHPVPARKYHFDTGTFRFATWHFHSHKTDLIIQESDADGSIVCLVLPRVGLENAHAICSTMNISENSLLLVLKPTMADRENILRYAAIINLLEQHQPLAKDEVARQELQRQRDEYRNTIDGLFGVDHDLHERLYRYASGNLKPIRWEEIGPHLSEKFKEVYSDTPIIQNELINSENPSPSAMIGLKAVVYGMIEAPHEETLGIKTTGPEYSIYLNVLKASGIHSKRKGKWGLGDPKDNKTAIRPAWDHLSLLLKKTQRSREKITIKSLGDTLRIAPYGIKDGLIKLLTIAAIFRHLPNLSLYERGTFTPQIYRDTVERMLKRPEHFSLQYVETSGVHQELFKEVYRLIEDEEKDYVSLMESIKPLILFANRLPYYTKKTSSLSARSKAMVDLLLAASEPEKLLYEDLPAAFDLPKITTRPGKDEIATFIETMDICHKEIRMAFDVLIDDCAKQMQKIWGAKSSQLGELRKFFRTKFSTPVRQFIADDALNALGRRVCDDKIDSDSVWFIAVISLIINKPVDKWLDRDKQYFVAEARLKAMQLEEIEHFVANLEGDFLYSAIEPEILEMKIEDLMQKGGHSREEMLLALMRVHNRLSREHRLEN